MSNINLLFRKRIGIPLNEVITFQNLDKVLEKTAKSIPFENLCIIENRTKEITNKNLTRKILKQHEGGLCYELYAFNSKEEIQNITELNEVQRIIIDHPESAFNKKPLITKITDKGNITLTDTSFTQWVDSALNKEIVDETRFKEIRKVYFNL
jgi:arylamine N-acetyltransferase